MTTLQTITTTNTTYIHCNFVSLYISVNHHREFCKQSLNDVHRNALVRLQPKRDTISAENNFPCSPLINIVKTTCATLSSATQCLINIYTGRHFSAKDITDWHWISAELKCAALRSNCAWHYYTHQAVVMIGLITCQSSPLLWSSINMALHVWKHVPQLSGFRYIQPLMSAREFLKQLYIEMITKNS